MVESGLVEVDEGDVHAVREAELGDGVADAGCTACYEGMGGGAEYCHFSQFLGGERVMWCGIGEEGGGLGHGLCG